MTRISTMAEYTSIPAKRRFERNQMSNRRRITDMPQPLDYVTRELVSEIIESKHSSPKPQKSIFQRLFGLN